MKFGLAFIAVMATVVPAFAADMPVVLKATGSAPISTNEIVDSNNQIILQAVGTNLSYAEHSKYDVLLGGGPGFVPQGGFLDGEKGWTSGMGLKLSFMNDRLFQNLYFSAEGSHTGGHTHYKGYLQENTGVPTTPYSGSDSAKFNDFSARFGKGFAINPSWMVTPFIEYGYHHWSRGVNDGETYEHQYVGGGGLIQVVPMSGLVWSTSAMIGSTLSPQIDIAATVNAPGTNGATLGTGMTWKVATGLDYAITPNWHVDAEVNYMEFKYGASGTLAGNIYEPSSTSKAATVKLGVGYSWGAGNSAW